MEATHAAPSTWRNLTRYAFAVALVALALLLSLVLEVSFGNPFWLFFPVAVIASTWFGGKGPGWVAVGLSTLVVLYYFIPPARSWNVKPRDIPFFLTFAACQVVASWLIAWRQKTVDSLRRARDELEVRVAERTAELTNANEALINQIAVQKRTEEALQIARTELARVARITTIGELTASIAHEVNQPLAAVVANADACVAWLSHQTPNLMEARAAAERTTHGATRASEVIVRIRSLINKATPEKAPVQINKVIQETAALADGQASRNGVSLFLQLQSDLPVVLGDGIQLQQVILNLVMNGIEAMSGVTGQPRQLVVRSRSEGLDQVLVSIQDCGVGIRPDIMPRLFEPFFTTRSQGMGMGLAISRSIIESHGGKLWAESTGSQGSIFQFTLPSAGGSN
ncbi:MAG: ATP-binding protein [Candidatus Acidiferrum sp.]|jgi:C4-dicarboxylate-specific signal transduction histidine kinase